MRILIVYWNMWGTTRREGVREHLFALQNHFPQHEYIYLDVYRNFPCWIAKVKFDAVILHNTFLCLRNCFDAQQLIKQSQLISKINAVKIAIPQDEYDEIEKLEQWLMAMETKVVLSNLTPHKEMLYPQLSSLATFHNVLTGYVGKSMELLADKYKNIQKRWLIGYRAAKLPYWFGELGQIKHRVGAVAKQFCQQNKLSENISTKQKDVIHGSKWYDFLASCLGSVGSESGASLKIPNKKFKQKVTAYLTKNPQASYQQVAEACFAEQIGKHWFSAVSPRHFECAALKVCQLLVEGEYQGILQANVHYIPIKKDFSNLGSAIEQLQDDSLREKIVNQAHQDLIVSGQYSYQKFSEIIIQHIPPAEEIIKPSTLLAWRVKAWQVKDKFLTRRLFREMVGLLNIYCPKLKEYLLKLKTLF